MTQMIYDMCTQARLASEVRPAEHLKEGSTMAMERWRPFGTADRWEPFRNMSDIQGEVNRLFDTFLGRPMAAAPATRAWLPAVDMHESQDDLVLTVEVPGVNEKDVTVSITHRRP